MNGDGHCRDSERPEAIPINIQSAILDHKNQDKVPSIVLFRRCRPETRPSRTIDEMEYASIHSPSGHVTQYLHEHILHGHDIIWAGYEGASHRSETKRFTLGNVVTEEPVASAEAYHPFVIHES